jgi:serine protease inhibitor
MIKKFLLFFLCTIHCFANSVGENEQQFALALYSKIKKGEDNMAFSPYGIFSNLSLVYYGADGSTAKQLKSALHLSKTGKKFLEKFQLQMENLTQGGEFGYQLSIANGLFPHKGTLFLKKFEAIATDTFQAKLQGVDFDIPDSTLSTINGWVSEQTKGKITQLLGSDDINAATRMILANAVYFQGGWVSPFSPKQTTSRPFHPEGGASFNAPMLHQTHPFPYYEDEHVQCLALPFVREQTKQPFLECLLVLPKKGTISQLEEQLSPKLLDEWLFSSKSQPVDAYVPKFCFSKKLSLVDPLKSLGVTDAFSYFANFSKMNGMKDLLLSQVLHETYFSFHENGVTAASATTSEIGIKSAPPLNESPIPFIADRPFLFFIVDYHSRAILFMGRMMNPQTDVCNGN